MIEKTRQLTIDGFMQLYEEAPFEIINGEHVPLYTDTFGKSEALKKVFDSSHQFEKSDEVGECFFKQCFMLLDRSGLVKRSFTPDAMFIRKERLDEYRQNTPDYEEKPLILVPDLVVEVVSPTDSYSDLNRKIEAYVDDGVKLIWVVDPQRKIVEIYEGAAPKKTLRIGDSLSGRDVAPGFEMAVGDVFATK